MISAGSWASPTTSHTLNWERFQDWEPSFSLGEARPALLAFNGDVYRGLRAAERFGERDFTHAQKHLRILSGLHGLLRPLDLIHPYRLEMGSAVESEHGRTLYEFWGDRITRALNEDLDRVSPKVVVNLASREYFSSVDSSSIDGRIISPVLPRLQSRRIPDRHLLCQSSPRRDGRRGSSSIASRPSGASSSSLKTATAMHRNSQPAPSPSSSDDSP